MDSAVVILDIKVYVDYPERIRFQVLYYNDASHHVDEGS